MWDCFLVATTYTYLRSYRKGVNIVLAAHACATVCVYLHSKNLSFKHYLQVIKTKPNIIKITVSILGNHTL
jgi:uncharacterized membrane protein